MLETTPRLSVARIHMSAPTATHIRRGYLVQRLTIVTYHLLKLIPSHLPR